ncbi:MAG: universal stress protein [Methanoregula sp.]|jgi:nucleotide-binding universal stress UspA family protein|nr:universal stress protein [Methanoregula sp.]
MFNNVLVPVDLSINSRSALRCLRHIPGLRQVEILHVVYNKYPSKPTDPVDSDYEHTRLWLEEIKGDVEKPDVTVRTIIEEIQGGEIFETINRIAAREGVALTVMGRRGRGIIDTLLLGSVASDILRYGKTDLLLVHNKRVKDTLTAEQDRPCPDLFSHVLVCTDFSDPEISDLCCHEVPSIRKVTLFHAVTTGDSSEEVRSSVDSAEAKLERMRDAFLRISIPAQVHVSVGSAAEEIISFSEKQDVSIILLKSTGKRSFLENLLGSTTARVARNSQKPVLVLRKSRGGMQ